jgi:uncharacterized protein YggE
MLIGILVLGAVIIVAIIRDRIVNNPQWQISVTGQGRVAYQPDTANVNMGVKVDKAAKADEALKQLNDKMNKVIESVKKAGIADEDIQTQNYTVIPHYDTVENNSKLTGYDANQIIVVKVRDIQKNSNVITKVVSAGSSAGVNQINGVSFEFSDMNKLRQDARVKAINDARSKSGEIAGALGVRLGKIVGWWENIIYPTEAQIGYKGDIGGLGMGGGGDTSGGNALIPSGSQELVIEVNVSYKIK